MKTSKQIENKHLILPYLLRQVLMHRAAVWAPYAYAVFNARGRQIGEGGVRCNRVHNGLVCLERADDAACLGIPDAHLTVITACTPA